MPFSLKAFRIIVHQMLPNAPEIFLNTAITCFANESHIQNVKVPKWQPRIRNKAQYNLFLIKHSHYRAQMINILFNIVNKLAVHSY